MKKRSLIIISAMLLIVIGIVFLFNYYAPLYLNMYLFPPSAKRYGCIALERIDRYGLYAEGPIWHATYDSCQEALGGVKKISDTYPIIEHALRVGGGKHSQFYGVDKEKMEGKTDSVLLPEVQFVEDFAIVKLPMFVGSSKMAKEYSESVEQVLHEHANRIRGVLVDLRDNRGGDVGPMLTALSMLLEDGDLMYYLYKGRDVAVTLHHGLLSNAGSGGTSLFPNEKLKVPIALLTNGQTASSAEALLTCFLGSSRSRTFGSPTAGYGSVNMSFDLFDGAEMVLTIALDKTIDGRVFGEEPIVPYQLCDDPEEQGLAWLRAEVSE